jgi:hypothetical protein
MNQDKQDMSDTSDAGDDLIGRALRAAGPRPELPPALAAEWAKLLHTELAPVVRRRRRRQIVGLAVAATVAVVAVALGVVRSTPWLADDNVLIATVLHTDGVSEDGDGRSIANGSGFAADARLRTGPHGFVGLEYRGADVRVHSNSEVVFRRTRLELRRGSVYVDTGPADSRTATPIVVETPFGSISHVGTQFIVAVGDQGLDGAVREGKLVLRTSWARRDLSARPGESAVVHITADRQMTTAYESLRSPRWQWIHSATEGFAIAGRSSAAALEWAAREAGMPLEYADDATRAHAGRVMLQGSVVTHSPAEMLALIGSSTRLSAVVSDDGSIAVALTPASETDQ